MRHRITFALLCCVGLCGPAWAADHADLILTNARAYTADPKLRWAEAVAVKGGNSVYVGSTDGVKAQRGQNTKEIDLGGRLLLPGFNDHYQRVERHAADYSIGRNAPMDVSSR